MFRKIAKFIVMGTLCLIFSACFFDVDIDAKIPDPYETLDIDNIIEAMDASASNDEQDDAAIDAPLILDATLLESSTSSFQKDTGGEEEESKDSGNENGVY